MSSVWKGGKQKMSQTSQSMLITNAFSNLTNATSSKSNLTMNEKSTSKVTTSSGSAFSQKLTDAKEWSKSSPLNANTQQTGRTSRLDAKPVSSDATDKKVDSKNDQVQKDDTKPSSKTQEKNSNDVKNDNNVKEAKPDSKESVESKSVAKEVTDEATEHNEVDEQVLAMVSQALQIPMETIQYKLTEIGMEVKDLMTEEGFGKFINEMLGQGNVEHLLSGEVDIKGITELFESLSELKQQCKELLNVNIKEITPQPEILNQNEMSQSTMQNLQEVPVNVSMVNATTLNGQNEQVQEEEPHTQVVMDLSGEVQGDTEGLGITVPIHHFTTTTFSQAFNSEAGVMTQTVTTKQVVNGKAFIEQIDFKVVAQTKEINVALSPKELGNMNIKIVENNGAMVAEIKVDNDKAKEVIQNEIQSLKDSLSEQGLNVTDVKVDIRQNNHQSQMEQERQKSSKRIQEIISNQLNDEELGEEEIQPQVSSESEVDYMV